MGETGQLAFEMRFGTGLDAGLADLVAGYRPLPGLYDELIGPDGRPRERFLPLLRSLAAGGPAQAARRVDKADRRLADAGVVYRV